MTKRDHEQYAADRFREDTKDHVMTIEHDDGLYRNILFRRPASLVCYYRITTWPGYLCISGDMGCYVFRRLNDMFTFFDKEHPNPGYWSEKVQAADRDGLTEFCEDTFKEAIKSHFDEWEFDTDEARAAAWTSVEEDLLSGDITTVESAVGAAMAYECGDNRFHDFWDHRLTRYTFRFLWACNAIPDAIRQYKEAKGS